MGATLVFAFLGHGQSHDPTTLWYMAADSKDQESLHCVNIGEMIHLAADHPGVAGVVALIDTCHAAAGTPSVDGLVGGFRNGTKQVALLAACSAEEQAFKLLLSRQVTARLSEGMAGRGEYLGVADIHGTVEGELAVHQAPRAFDYYGGTDAARSVWLGRNRSRSGPPSNGCLGPLGIEALGRALGDWPEAPTGPLPRTRQELAALAERAAAAGIEWTRSACTDLLVALDAVTAVVEVTGAGLTTRHLHRMVNEFNRQWSGRTTGPVQPPAGLSDRALLSHLLEDAVLRAPAAAPYSMLAWYLVAAAHACGLEPHHERILRWARVAGAEMALNDAAAQYAEHTARDAGRRLVISLDAALVDWPDVLSVCLRDSADCVAHRNFDCRPDRAGVEGELPEVLEWAEELASETGGIRAVDFVVTAPVLLDWHPEETVVGIRCLGVDYEVTLRWAGRLVEPGHFRGMNRQARRQLEALDGSPFGPVAPVDWMDPAATTLDRLRTDLRRGQYRRPIGLTNRGAPTVLREVVDILLPHAPILLWPRTDHPSSEEEWHWCLTHLWAGLPARFSDAYRRALGGPDPFGDPPDPVTDAHLLRLAALSTAWHDLPWLDFCAGYHRHPAPRAVVPAPRST
ncbi:hypothetical protein [Kitasatospora saccharophila]|uniref:vWA-MoxR associated conflict system protein n=1 Tax=Kitasatospora saccharophila TaxID=407973 RepID=UPI0031E2373E